MKFNEINIMVRGLPVLNLIISDYNLKETNLIIKTALLSGLLSFAQITMAPLEYLESSHYLIVFYYDSILDEFSNEEPIITYGIVDKIVKKEEKKVIKIIKKEIIPVLENISDQFIYSFNGRNLSEVSQFEGFKDHLENKLRMKSNLTQQLLSQL